MTFWICLIFGIAYSIVIFLPLIREDIELQEQRKKIAEIAKKLDQFEDKAKKTS